MGIKTVQISPVRKTSSTILRPPSSGTAFEKNKSNKQYSARLTQWLDRLNQFDITLKYTAGKEIKFTDFISRNHTEIAEQEENYEQEFVVNAIAQLATANYCIGRIFNQSDHSNTAVMHDTRRTQTGTRCNKTNNHSNFQTTAKNINHTVTDNYHLKLAKNQTMDNNNNEDMQEPERYPRDEEGRLKYHPGRGRRNNENHKEKR